MPRTCWRPRTCRTARARRASAAPAWSRSAASPPALRPAPAASAIQPFPGDRMQVRRRALPVHRGRITRGTAPGGNPSTVPERFHGHVRRPRPAGALARGRASLQSAPRNAYAAGHGCPGAGHGQRRIPDAGVGSRFGGRVRTAVFPATARRCTVSCCASCAMPRWPTNCSRTCGSASSPRARLAPDATFATWLYRIAHNRLNDHWRAAKHRRRPRGRGRTHRARLPDPHTPSASFPISNNAGACNWPWTNCPTNSARSWRCGWNAN